VRRCRGGEKGSLSLKHLLLVVHVPGGKFLRINRILMVGVMDTVLGYHGSELVWLLVQTAKVIERWISHHSRLRWARENMGEMNPVPLRTGTSS